MLKATHRLPEQTTKEKEIKTMTKMEMVKAIEELQELEAFMEEIKAEAETIKDSLKAEMLERDTEELEAGAYIIRWTSVLSNRFDTTSFKKVYGDLYKSFTKQVSSKRFCISC
jgi:predicted phage-related endonuclease